mgnify:CR=1 FL=1
MHSLNIHNQELLWEQTECHIWNLQDFITQVRLEQKFIYTYRLDTSYICAWFDGCVCLVWIYLWYKHQPVSYLVPDSARTFQNLLCGTFTDLSTRISRLGMIFAMFLRIAQSLRYSAVIEPLLFSISNSNCDAVRALVFGSGGTGSSCPYQTLYSSSEHRYLHLTINPMEQHISQHNVNGHGK